MVFIQLNQEFKMGNRQHGNKVAGYINVGEFLDWLSYSQILNIYSALKISLQLYSNSYYSNSFNNRSGMLIVAV
jgi:hypothetical protein